MYSVIAAATGQASRVLREMGLGPLDKCTEEDRWENFKLLLFFLKCLQKHFPASTLEGILLLVKIIYHFSIRNKFCFKMNEGAGLVLEQDFIPWIVLASIITNIFIYFIIYIYHAFKTLTQSQLGVKNNCLKPFNNSFHRFSSPSHFKFALFSTSYQMREPF